MNIFRKKSRRKIASILLLTLFFNYLISPLSVFAGSHLTAIETKVTEIEQSITSAKQLNTLKETSCLSDRYCVLATGKITTMIDNEETKFYEIKNGLTLDRLVSLTSTPTGYDKLTVEDKTSVVNYSSVVEVNEDYVASLAYCEVAEVVDSSILTEDDCTTATGTWHPAVTATATITVDQIENMVLTVLDSIATKIDELDDESSYETVHVNKVSELRTAEQAEATTILSNLVTRGQNLLEDKTLLLNTLEALNTLNEGVTVTTIGETTLNDYLALFDDIYEFFVEVEAFTTDYNEFINNEVYSYAYGLEWDSQIEDIITIYESLIANSNLKTKTEVNALINEYTNIDSLNDTLITQVFLESLYSNIKTNLPMVNNENIKKIEDAILQYYVLVSSDPNVVINHTDRTIITSYIDLAKTDFISKVSMASGSYVISGLNSVTTPEGGVVETLQTGSIITVKTTADVVVATYNVSVIGDANSDGNVDLTDLQMLESLVLGNTTTTDYTKTQLNALDYNGDGQYNITDIVMLYSVLSAVSN